MKITFLVHAMYGLGGTIRTTLNTASALADRGHEVEIVSVMRSGTVPRLEFDPRVRVISLIDRRQRSDRADGDGGAVGWRDQRRWERPSTAFPTAETIYHKYNALADRRVARFLRHHSTDVYVGTRPGLNVYLSQFAAGRAVVVGQEHMFHDYHSPTLRKRLSNAYRRLDAFVTVSATDARTYRETMPHLADRIHYIPNTVPPCRVPPADGSAKTVIAAGRIEKVKRYDLLIRAFGEVVRSHPDWRLRIYGVGTQVAELRELIGSLGLNNSVMMMGAYSPIDTEWVKGSIAAVTSEYESFGLTIIEAMGAGLPVVSTACRMGPLELIDSGVDGLLVAPGDVGAIAGGIRKLIENPKQRRDMSAAALHKARRFRPDVVVARHEQLFAELVDRHRGRTAPPLRLRDHLTKRSYRSFARTDTVPTPEAAVTVSCRSLGFDHVNIDVDGDIGSARLVSSRHHAPVSLPVTERTIIVEPKLLRGMAAGVWHLELDGRQPSLNSVDTRVLALGRGDTEPVLAAVPFADRGRLAIRLWKRKLYAEVDSVRVLGGTIEVTCVPFGSVPIPEDLRGQLTRTGSAPVEIPITYDGSRVRLRIDTAVLVAAKREDHEVWNLGLESPMAPGLRIRPGAFFDDVTDKRRLVRYPVIGHGDVHIEPYFMNDNQLAIRVVTEPGGVKVPTPG